MFRFRNKTDDSRYVDWVRSWDISFPILKRINRKWKLVPKKIHFEQQFKAMPVKEYNVYTKKWKSEKNNVCFELVLGGESVDREEVMRKNRELFEQARKNMQGKKGFIPCYSEAYIRAKELLENRKNGISVTLSIE